MKNYIKNFSQFQKLNEQSDNNENDTPFDGENHPDNFEKLTTGDDDLFEDGEALEELLDAVSSRMYENGMNGTLSSDGNVTCGYYMDGKNRGAINVDLNGGEDSYEFIIDQLSNNAVTYKVENGDIYGPYTDIYILTDSISQYILNVHRDDIIED